MAVSPDGGGFDTGPFTGGPDMHGFIASNNGPSNYFPGAGRGPDVGGNFNPVLRWNPFDTSVANTIFDNGKIAFRQPNTTFSVQNASIRGVAGRNSGKLYFEYVFLETITGTTVGAMGVGDINVALNASSVSFSGNYVVIRVSNGQIFQGLTFVASFGATWNIGDVLGVQIDFGAHAIGFWKNGATNSGGVWAIPAGLTLYPIAMFDAGADGRPPSGFLVKLNTLAEEIKFMPALYSAWGV